MNAEAVELVLAHVKAGLASGSLSKNDMMRVESLEELPGRAVFSLQCSWKGLVQPQSNT